MRPPRGCPTTLHLECRVTGCGYVAETPVVYRLEHLEVDAPTFGDPAQVFTSTRMVVDVDATLALEAPLRAHLDEHARNGAPPVTEPPSWAEVEWCDAGVSCEHDTCLAALDAHLEVADEDDRRPT